MLDQHLFTSVFWSLRRTDPPSGSESRPKTIGGPVSPNKITRLVNVLIRT